MNSTIPATMHAVYLTGYGGLEKLEYRNDVPVPKPKADEVLIRVGACGMNNTDINTRTGWYSKSVSEGTTTAGGTSGFAAITADAATWGSSSVSFPRVQGADIAGHIVAVGEDVAQDRIGERVLVDAWVRNPKEPENRNLAGYVGSERDGGYAEYAAIPAVNAFRIESTLTDPELATFPCSYSTGEYMLTRARLSEGETILITGASGGVGSALIQLAKRRGAEVIAVAGATKLDVIRGLGADSVIPRDAPDLGAAVRVVAPGGEVDVVADIVGGDRLECRLFSSGDRINPWQQEASHRLIRPNELVAFDTDMIGPFGYAADVSRTFFSGPGKPNTYQKELYQRAHEEVHQNLGLMRPGMSFKEITEKAYRQPERFVANRYPVLAHGVGMCDEWPAILYPQDYPECGYDGVLEPGMVMSVESYVGEVGGPEGVKLEQQIVITEDGHKLLCKFPFEEELLA